MAPPAISAITMALATPSSSIDIVLSDTKMGAGAGFIAAAKRHHGLPPTPPNSLSPNMPAQAVHDDFSSPAPDHLDLAHTADGPVAPAAVPLSKGALADLERQQVITSSLLARDYLPKILLGHPEMPIRQIMACLTHELRGFSRLDPPKARRMVVAALDSRHGGGRDGSVQFQKVAWGRWMAFVKGEKPPARAISFSRSRMSPAPSEASSITHSYSGSTYPTAKSRRPSAYRGPALGQSYTGSDMPSLDECLEDMSMSDHFVENMSIDGLDDISESDTSADETDEEDWSAIGAAALRTRNSISTAAAAAPPRRDYNMLYAADPIQARRRSSVRSYSKPRIASSAPATNFTSSRQIPFNNHHNASNANTMDVDTNTQDHDAARALLSLGSM